MQSYANFIMIDSLIDEIQAIKGLQVDVNLHEELYHFRTLLCQNILTKHPQNEPLILDFSNLILNEISDTAIFNNKVEQLTLEVNPVDRKVIIEICQLLSVPKVISINNSKKSMARRKFQQ